MHEFWSNLWQRTRGYGATGPRLGYLTDEQNCRLERIRVARMLWKGQHRCAYLEEGRTQFDFARMRVQGREIQPYFSFNLLRKVSTTFADLLIGTEPLLRMEQDQEALNKLVKRSDLHRVFYDAVKEASWAAEGTVEIVVWNKQVYVQNIPPGEIFPIGPRNPDGQYSQYRRFATATIGSGDMKTTLLLETTYSPGLITRECYRLDGTRKTDKVPVAQWPVKRGDGTDLPEKEGTPIDVPSVVWFANELDEGHPTSDYDGLIDAQDLVNSKRTQLAIVLAKHSDPILVLPGFMADAGGNFPANHKLLWKRGPDDKPEYVTWNAEIAGAHADLEAAVDALLIEADVSKGLLGIDKGAAPDSARKLRLQATPSLARTNRKGTFFRPFMRTTIDTAIAMENGNGRINVFVSEAAASVDLRDGLPVDDLDEANTLSILTGGGKLMSLERAVQRQLPDPEAAAEEIARIKQERASAMPTILTGLGGSVGDQGAEAGAGDEQQQPTGPGAQEQTL